MKVIFTLIATAFIGISYVSAVPAYPHPLTVTQSDGTQITIRIVGDEYRHHMLSSEGYTLTGGSDGDLYYATLAKDGSLTPTSVKARPLGRLTAAERLLVSKLVKGIKPTKVSKLQATRKFVQAPQMRADGKLTPPARLSAALTKGKLKSLVILVNYKDTKYTVSNPKQAFQNMLMQDGYSVNGATGSAWNYYQDNSNKQFDPQFDVYGPYTVKQKSAYYAGSEGTDNAAEMIVEAAKLADADVDFRQYADNGTVRNIFVFYAGNNQAETEDTSTVWPHQWNLTEDSNNDNVYLDGQHLDGYACSSEYNGWGVLAGIGTFCHEFGHVLGWHDFYDVDYEDNGQSAALESFSLMCSGSYNNEGRTPPAVNIMERWMAGWAEPIDITNGGTFLLDPVWKDKGYIVRTPTTNDYFLLENRAAGSFKWDNYIVNSNNKVENAKGLLVYHVDYTTPSQWAQNLVNYRSSHECMKLVRSVPSSSGSPSKTFFPGSSNVTTLSMTSNEDYKSWKNVAPLLSFTNISLVGEQVKLVSPSDGKFTATVTTSQYDALVSWENPGSAEWQITWAANGTQVGTKTTSGSAFHIDGLTPGTAYELTMKSGTTEFKDAFMTESLSAGKGARIYVPAGGFSNSTPVMLSILDFGSDVSVIEWSVDGSKVTNTYLTLAAGEHKVKASVTAKDGTKTHIIKYITVK